MRAKKIDANQRSIVDGLRKCGFSVAVTSSLGNDFPDLVIAKSGKNMLVELKNHREPSKRLTPGQKKFLDEWRGLVIVSNSLEEIIQRFNEVA
jgi:Holliday junction resolvase